MRRKHDGPVLITEKLQSSTPWSYSLSRGSSARGYSHSSACPANGSISLDEIGKTHVCLEIPKRPRSAPQNPRSNRSWYGDLLTFYVIKRRVGPSLHLILSSWVLSYSDFIESFHGLPLGPSPAGRCYTSEFMLFPFSNWRFRVSRCRTSLGPE